MTDLQFTRDIIKFDAANMDAAEFQQFLDDNKISYEWVEVTVGDYNDGIYDVYLFRPCRTLINGGLRMSV